MQITGVRLNNISNFNFSAAHGHKMRGPKNTTIPKDFNPYEDGYITGMVLKEEYLKASEEGLPNENFNITRGNVVKLARVGYPKREDCDRFVRGFEKGFSETLEDDPYDFYPYTRNGRYDDEDALCYTNGRLSNKIEIPEDYVPEKNFGRLDKILNSFRQFFLNFKR